MNKIKNIKIIEGERIGAEDAVIRILKSKLRKPKEIRIVDGTMQDVQCKVSEACLLKLKKYLTTVSPIVAEGTEAICAETSRPASSATCGTWIVYK